MTNFGEFYHTINIHLVHQEEYARKEIVRAQFAREVLNEIFP